MENTKLSAEEVILYKGTANSSMYRGSLKITLTSCKIIIEKEKGIFKKELELLDIINLEDIKSYNEAVQIKQKGNLVEIQTIGKNISLSFAGIFEARKFTGKAVNAVTGTTWAVRGSDKVKSAFNMIDDTLGLDTRGTIKGILEHGIKGTVINGINKTAYKNTADEEAENKS